MPAITVHPIQHSHEFEELRPEWERLFECVPSATPFQSPAWLLTWWRHFGNGQLRTIALRHHDELVGLFPLYIDAKANGDRELKFIGTGISDYLDGLVAPTEPRAVYSQLLNWLGDSSDRWNILNLEQLRPDSPLLQFSADSPTFTTDAVGCLAATLPETIDAWHASISPSLSRDIRYSWRRAQTMGTVRFEIATSATIDQFLQRFFSLHAARWTPCGGTGVLADPILERFHHEAAARLLAAGMLRLCLLTLNDEPMAGVYGFSHRSRFYIYLTAFDPRFAKYSFGSLAISAAIELAIHESCREVDFLRGREPYKLRFGATENRLVSFRCPAEALRGCLPIPATTFVR